MGEKKKKKKKKKKKAVFSLPQYDDDAELYQIPPLGQHFSRKWAVEDLKEEREEAAKLAMMAEPGNRAMENGGWQEESGMSE